MTPRRIQTLLAFVFFGLGGWALLFPSQVLSLGLRPELYTGDRVTAIIMGCFGAQAVLGGTVMLLTRFTPGAFLVFGLLGSFPFFGFNYYFVFVEEVFTPWMLLDVFGNIAILGLCTMGYLGMKRAHMEIT